MSSRLKAGESPRKGIRRVVRGQIDKAIEDLSGRDDPGETVHSARKRFKRIRALLRLARDGMDETTHDREAARFRDLGRPLSEVRDAAVLVDAFDRLIERSGDGGHPGEVAAAREALRARKDDATGRVLGDGEILDGIASALDDARDALDGRAFAGVRWSTLREGLRRIYGRGRRALRSAVEGPTDENLHEWRKRVKDFGHALGVIEPIRPRFARRQEELADQLADLLGDDHDLAVLRMTLLGGTAPAAAVVALRPPIDARRAELRDGAFALGRKLYRERPSALADHLDRSWHAWRSTRLERTSRNR